jgi:uncharacterized protein (DUF58 family)
MRSRESSTKSKTILFITRLAPLGIFPGEWESVMAGQGFDLLQIRPYQQGDDLRNLHLPSLMQKRRKRIVDRISEKQMKMYIYSDFSRSMDTKADTRDIAVALISFSSGKIYSALSLIAFSDGVKHIFPPAMGNENVRRIVDWSLEERSYEGITNIRNALSHSVNFCEPRSLVFLISDFFCELDYFEEMKKARQMFDVVPVIVRDSSRMTGFNGSSCFVCKDPETGKESPVYLSKKEFVKIQHEASRFYSQLDIMFGELNMQYVTLSEPSVTACYREFQKFFAKRLARVH